MPTHRLAAILFADIVGYTAMMQADEAAGIARASLLRRLVEELLPPHGGKLVEMRGDGAFCLFDSSTEAVRFADKLQQAIQAEVPLRIGIHLGDITQREGHIFGDAVNIASRIESMGVAGAVLLSSSVCQQIKNKPEFELASIGKFSFKNVEKPMEVFALTNEGLVVPGVEELRGKAKAIPYEQASPGPTRSRNVLFLGLLGVVLGGLIIWVGTNYFSEDPSPSQEVALPTDKSIAVLPFRNLSGDSSQEFISDGITEDIMINLAKIEQLKVIARSSSFSFKGQDIPTPDIAARLKVNHVLEGSVRKVGQNLRVSTQLVHAASGNMLWGENYDRNLEDVLLVQEEVAREIAYALSLQLTAKETRELNRATKVNPTAYQYSAEVKQFLMSFSLEDYQRAKDLLLEAIKLDSTFAEPHILLGNYYINRAIWVGDLPSQEALQYAQPYLEKAASLDPNSPNLNRAMGMSALWLQWDFEAARQYFLKSKFEGAFLGVVFLLHTYLGEMDQLEEGLNQLKEIDPFNPDIYSSEAFLHYFQHDIPQAIEACQRAIRITPDRGDNYKLLANMYREQGRAEEAIRVLEARMKIMNFRPPFFLGELATSYHAAGKQAKAREVLEELHAIIEQNGQGSPAYFLAMTYANLGEKDLAFTWLEKSFELHEVEMVWLKMDPLAKPLHSDPRFENLLQRVGFPQ